MKTIYVAIINRLKEQVPALRWIDLDVGQVDTPVRASVAWPAALIGIEMTQARNYTETHQTCVVRIPVNLCFNNTPDRTSANAPDEARERSLRIYDTIAEVYKALQGFETENFNTLHRVSQGKIARNDGMFLYRITFECEFEDITAEQ